MQAQEKETSNTLYRQWQILSRLSTGKWMGTRELQEILQREGIDIALAEGRPYGRPKLEINEKFMEAYKKWKLKEITAVAAMNMAGYNKSTWYNRVKEIES